MASPLSKELTKLAPPRGLLPLHRDADGPLTIYYRIGVNIQSLAGWDVNSPLLRLANFPGDADSLVQLPGSIAADQITIPYLASDLADLNEAGVWDLLANDGTGQRVLARGDQVGDLVIIEGVA